MDIEASFQIIIEKPPAGIDYALQKGHGKNYETIQKQRSGAGDLVFEFPAKIKTESKPGIDLSGPFVQGPKGGRFVYVGIGTYAGQTSTPWSRRMKVPLLGITIDMLSQLKKQPQLILRANVPGTDKKGEPTCAMVKPFAGWHLASQ